MARARSYHHGDLPGTLIRLATAAIAAGGADTVSVRALAREAGVAHRSAYQHFEDREALLAATFAAAHDRVEARLARALSGVAGAEERLVALAVAYAAFAFDEPEMFLAMNGRRVNSDGRFPVLEAAIARTWRFVVGPIRDGVASGAFAIGDTFLAAAIYWGGLQGVIAQAALNRLKLKKSERGAFFRTVGERLVAALKA